MIVDTYRWNIQHQHGPFTRTSQTQYWASEDEIRVRYPMAQRVAESWRQRRDLEPGQPDELLFAA